MELEKCCDRGRNLEASLHGLPLETTFALVASFLMLALLWHIINYSASDAWDDHPERMALKDLFAQIRFVSLTGGYFQEAKRLQEKCRQKRHTTTRKEPCSA